MCNDKKHFSVNNYKQVLYHNVNGDEVTSRNNSSWNEKVQNIRNDQRRNWRATFESKKNQNIHITTAKVEVEKEKWSQDDFSGQPHQIHTIIDNDDESLDVRDDDTVQIDEANSVKAEGVLSYETLEDLGNFTSSILRKEKLRFSKVDVKEVSFLITSEEWSQMIKNRSKYHFRKSDYSEIILRKLRTLYSGCVLRVRNNYLKKNP